jgi:hypothetical protein
MNYFLYGKADAPGSWTRGPETISVHRRLTVARGEQLAGARALGRFGGGKLATVA